MPRRHPSHVLEDESLDQIRPIFTQSGWTVDELKKDYGEDLLVRIFDNELATPFSFYVQAKASDKSANGTDIKFTEDAIHIRLKRESMEAWQGKSDPVILIHWHKPSNQLLWQCIQDYLDTPLGNTEMNTAGTISEFRKKVWLNIPRDNTFDKDGSKLIRLLTIKRYSRLKKWRDSSEIIANIIGFIVNAEAVFDAERGFILIRHTDRLTIIPLNELERLLDRFEEESGEPSENLVLPFIRQMREFANASAAGEQLVHRDCTGSVIATYRDKHELEQALAENVGLRRFDYSFVEDALIKNNTFEK